MKALTLWRPWPYAIFHLPPEIAKLVENRSWKPPRWLIGERIAIHAGATFDNDGADLIGARLDELGLLAGLKKTPGHNTRVKAEGIIGTAIVAGCCHIDGMARGRGRVRRRLRPQRRRPRRDVGASPAGARG